MNKLISPYRNIKLLFLKTSKKSFFILSVFILLIAQFSYSQEICDNGIDDDGDGFIDLNDVGGCTCVPVVVTVPSLIPNPSFEVSNCNPTSYSQLNCANGWVQATTATSDYFNTSYNFPAATANGLVPPPDGSGYVGAIFSTGYQEYVGSCLVNPMLAGAAYSLNFNIASGYIDGSGGNVGGASPPPTSVVIYGSTNCALPLNTMACPVGINGWYVLGVGTTSGTSGWQTMTIDFTPPANVNAVMIGAACGFQSTTNGGNYDYHYFDNLVLNAESAFTSINLNGDWCTEDLTISGPPSPGATYQWFKGGIAIVGQTDTLLAVSANNFTAGDYTLITYFGGNCSRANLTLNPPVITIPTLTAVAPLCSSAAPITLITSAPNGNWSGTGITNAANGTFDPSVAGPGNHVITFTQTGICNGAATMPITVRANPVANFSVASVCSGITSSFVDLSTIAGPEVISTWAWAFADGQVSALQNPTHDFPNDGIYANTLLVTTANGCTGTTTLNNTVWPLPITSFTTSNNCIDDNSIFTNTSTISSTNTPNTISTSAWTFGDAAISGIISPTHLYSAAGTYNVTLTSTSANGCATNVANPITIHPKPVIVFTVPNVCSNLTSVFTDASTIVTGTIASWNWNFGGANTSAVQNPSFNFGAAGTHPVTLTATSNFGCVQSLTQNATTYALPIANFTVASVCSGLTSSFVDISTVAGPEVIDTWAWTFSDAQVSALQNPTHDFPNEGIYATTLLVTTTNGCTGTTTLNNTVWPLPVPSFTVPNNCFATNSVFTNTSTISSVNTPNTISNYAWNFGNGATSSLSAPTHLYSAPGTYTVRLIATSQHGCIDSARSNFIVYSLPIADFSVDPTCFGVGSEFVDFSTIILPDVISTWNWSFGDNTTSSLQNPTHLFPSQNNYSNRLIITSNQGCKDTIVKTNTVWPLPNVDFNVTDVCLNFANVFTDNSIISNQHTSNSNVGWLWTLGDGSVIPTQNGSHTYAADGTYNVKLRVTSNHGCRDSLTKVATVHPKPNAIVNGVDLTGCSPICPSLTSISTVNAPGVITNLQWVYSDGAIGNGTNSIRCFENTTDHTEIYDVTLFVQTDKGCKDTFTNLNYIQVYHLPIANFTYLPSDPDIHRNRVEFTNTSLYASTYEWEFSNNQTSTLVSPDIEFDNGPGFYTAQLIATTYNGCKDTVIREILVKDVVTYWIPNTFTPNSDVFNNTWKPVIYSGIDEFSIHIMVFNRWGEMIWESFDPNVGWDGNYGGTPVQDGTCTWKFEYKVKGIDKRQTDVGHVNVLR